MKGQSPIGKVSYRITVNLEIQPEGCYMVTCEELPELLTQGDSIEEALHHTLDAFMATIELYEDVGKEIPGNIIYPIESANLPTVSIPALTGNKWTQTDLANLFKTETPESKRCGDSTPSYVFEAIVPNLSDEIPRSIQKA